MVLLLVIPYFALVTILLLVVERMDLRNGIVMVSMLVQVHFLVLSAYSHVLCDIRKCCVR